MVVMRYWKFQIVLLFLFCWGLSSCSWKPIRQFAYVENAFEPGTRRASELECSATSDYIPWSGFSGITPVRTIRLNIHFMNSSDGSKNLKGQRAIRFATQLVESANRDLANNQKMRLPLRNQTPVLDPLIRYEIVSDAQGNPAIYEHFDDAYYYLVKKGPGRNNYNRAVIDKFGIGLDSILNIFIQAPPPDSLIGENYGGLKTGVALRNGIRISGPFLTDDRIYTYTGLFNHEVGHILGLRHAWLRDQCDDTPTHSNCWNFTNDGSECDSLVSNNVMDSNADQDAYTPCQIGIIQHSLAEARSTKRRFQKDSYCRSQGLDPVHIRDTVIWCRETDVVSDVIIDRNATLIITNRVSMPEGGRILIERNGKLILRGDKAVIQNACGFPWQGVFSKTNQINQVVLEKGSSIVLD